MLREEIIKHLGEDWTDMNCYIKEALSSDIALLQEVNDDLISHGGKMLRPMVAILVARMLSGGKASRESVKVAAAVEMLHNATLLHDDVADDSPTRRGEPTLASKIGPSTAVLIGDFWLAKAMELTLTSATRSSMAKVVSKAMTNLAEGEMLQLQKSYQQDTCEEDYFRIIYCKTASLFEAACLGSAITCDASQEQQEAVAHYAKCLGIAFQIRDDILDYVGDVALGKPVGIDLKEHKITLPLLCAMKGSKQEAEIRKMISQTDSHPEYCEQIRKFVLDKEGAAKAEIVLEEYIDRSVRALETLPDGEDKNYLIKIARYNTIRRI
ncbi:MAG: polyprenyl synthetase family protein [Candidatus Cryptobacteroides sp.]